MKTPQDLHFIVLQLYMYDCASGYEPSSVFIEFAFSVVFNNK